MNRLKEARANSGLSLRALAALAKVNQETISELENGKRFAQLATLVKLARALSIPLEELLSLEDTSASARGTLGANIKRLNQEMMRINEPDKFNKINGSTIDNITALSNLWQDLTFPDTPELNRANPRETDIAKPSINEQAKPSNPVQPLALTGNNERATFGKTEQVQSIPSNNKQVQAKPSITGQPAKDIIAISSEQGYHDKIIQALQQQRRYCWVALEDRSSLKLFKYEYAKAKMCADTSGKRAFIFVGKSKDATKVFNAMATFWEQVDADSAAWPGAPKVREILTSDL